jgi:dienelactone hydrolase
MVDTVDQFLLRELDRSITRRSDFWQRDLSSLEAYQQSIVPQRQRLARILGIRDERVPFEAIELIATTKQSAQIGSGLNYDVLVVRWPAFGDVFGEGLLLEPRDHPARANVIALPDCEVLPEQLVGLMEGVPANCQFARRLAEAGCRVVVPLLINRQRKQFDWGPRPAPDVTNREMLYRSAFELGRGVIGYELQKLLAVVDCWSQPSTAPPNHESHPRTSLPIGVIGWAEGGLLALYAGAIEPRIQAVCVSGYFDSRQRIWQEPIDRNVFGLLEQFGDAELATMIFPRSLIVEAVDGPTAELPGNGGAPAILTSPARDRVEQEIARAERLLGSLAEGAPMHVVGGDDVRQKYGSDEALQLFLQALDRGLSLPATSALPETALRALDSASRHRRQMRELDRHSQQLLHNSGAVRAKFMERLDTSSLPSYEQSADAYRDYFAKEVIGRFDYPFSVPNPRTRLFRQDAKWHAYEVVLDVFDGIFAYGLLLIPHDLVEGERRPVVVCQHGLEGRPQDTIGAQGSEYYAGFAGQLADEGFVTFAPQNLYIGGDRFRTLQRKSYVLKKTLFSTIVAQHQQVINWLKTLPFVDSERIAFYGLSYGGKTAMRVPPIVTDYCLSICSADFNDWVDKNASTTNPRSYVWTGEYEIFEFDLGHTFNYAEMAALIAPRPFMVERGHFDGVADDWTVAWEFAKVRHLYAARLKLPQRCAIEWFDGPHQIHGQGTFQFLRRQFSEGIMRKGAP